MENWKFALSSIMGHKMRSFLTMLGIIIGVASVVVIMALGQGMTKQITDMFSADTRDIEIYYVAKDSDSKGILTMILKQHHQTKVLKFRKNGCKKSLLMSQGFKTIT